MLKLLNGLFVFAHCYVTRIIITRQYFYVTVVACWKDWVPGMEKRFQAGLFHHRVGGAVVGVGETLTTVASRLLLFRAQIRFLWNCCKAFFFSRGRISVRTSLASNSCKLKPQKCCCCCCRDFFTENKKEKKTLKLQFE